MQRLPYLLKSACYICLFLTVLFPVSSLLAQQPITQAQIDTLLTAKKQKIKIIHVNGGWCRICYEMMPFIDYLNTYKSPHIETTVVLTTSFANKRGHKKLLYWLKERGITINYYVIDRKQYLESKLHQSIPVTYVIQPDGNQYRFVGSTDMHKKNILHPIQKSVPKTIEAVDALYKQRKEDSRKIINYDDKDYELNYSETFVLRGSKGSYNTHIKAYEGDVFQILSKGEVYLGIREGRTTPAGVTNDALKEIGIVKSVNLGKLMAFVYDKNGKAVHGVQVGTGARFKATKSGKLVLKINDHYYQNNQGQFEGQIMRFSLIKD